MQIKQDIYQMKLTVVIDNRSNLFLKEIAEKNFEDNTFSVIDTI